MNSARVRKNIKQGKIDLNFEESALVVHYDLELVSLFFSFFFFYFVCG